MTVSSFVINYHGALIYFLDQVMASVITLLQDALVMEEQEFSTINLLISKTSAKPLPTQLTLLTFTFIL